MSSVNDLPQVARAIIPEVDDIKSLAESVEISGSETTLTPNGEATA
jgi:hypothetical protein